MAKKAPAMRCACGEHFVASYLSGLGVVVAMTRGGSPTTDMIVTSEHGGRSVSLQVKTGGIYSRQRYKKKPEKNCWVWRTGAKAMDAANPSHWFAFVYVGEWPGDGDFPMVFFVPSKVVSKTLRGQNKSQQDWFWMYDTDAKQYSGLEGFKKLAESLD